MRIETHQGPNPVFPLKAMVRTVSNLMDHDNHRK